MEFVGLHQGDWCIELQDKVNMLFSPGTISTAQHKLEGLMLAADIIIFVFSKLTFLLEIFTFEILVIV